MMKLLPFLLVLIVSCSSETSYIDLLNKGYKNSGDPFHKNYIPDYSFSGYKKGGVKLPEADVVLTLSPTGGDDTPIIQEAIDQVSGLEPGADGIKGAILLKKGRYTINGSLYIKSSGVVLRGEGQGEDGTVLYTPQQEKHNLINLGGEYRLEEVEGSRTLITSKYNSVGSSTITVEDVTPYSVGDSIAIVRTPNKKWLETLDMSQWGWTEEIYTITHERTVTAIDGNDITFDIPLVDVIEKKYGGGYVYKSERFMEVTNCGIESMRFESFYKHDEDDNHGWIAINLNGVENSWVKNVTAEFFGYSTVNMEANCFFNTVQDSAYLSGKSVIRGGRRYSFAIQKGLGNLIQRCYSNEGRHDWVTGSRVTGPNTFLDCYTLYSFSDSGPHHRWATGVLFDNVKANELHVENRTSMGTGHGWSGAQMLFWNCRAVEIVCDTAPGAMNIAVGSIAKRYRKGRYNSQEADGLIISPEEHVEIRSLYIHQLKERLGMDAVNNVIIPEQLSGDMDNYLKEWAGQ